jgi:hypothetical protein
MNKPNSKKRLELAQRRDAPLTTRTDLSHAATKDIGATMNAILADVFALYVKTKNFHWHMSGPHFRDYHLLLDVFGVVIKDTLSARDLADRVQRESAKLSNALGDWIRHGKKLVGVLVEQQMVIAEMRAAHVPVEIFRLHVKREHISKNGIHGAAYIFSGRVRQISTRGQGCVASLHQLQSFFRIRFVHRCCSILF